MSAAWDDAPRGPTAEERFHATGDVDAFRELASPHLDALYTLCRRMLGDGASADDTAQDALIRAMERHHLYDPARPFRPWLLTIGANLCRNALRRPWWRFWAPLTDAEASPRPDPERALDQEQTDDQLHAALLELEPIYREAITLFHLTDMTYEEMHAITGVEVPALKQRVRRARQHLEKILFRRYPESWPERTPGED